MRAFSCRVCQSALYFENSVCVSCKSNLGFSRKERSIVPVDQTGRYVDAEGYIWHICTNLNVSGCTWLAELDGGYCFSCRLTRTRPSNADVKGIETYSIAEESKRRLIVQLDELNLPIYSRSQDPETGLAFDLLSSSDGVRVATGHHNGIITVDLAEGDDVHREELRVSLEEPYRTMLGHFRHEIGHYYWALLVQGELLNRCREIFGDERVSYSDAASRHYSQGPPSDWGSSFISRYASMHPWEDFAETFAHYLHICDTIDTAEQYGLARVNISGFRSFSDLVTGVWIPLSIALNQINRSMGKGALYPFVIPKPVLEKLEFVASLAPGPQT